MFILIKEIVLIALREPALYKACRPLVIGDAQRLEAAKKCTGSRLNEPLMGHMGSAHGAKAKRLCVSGMGHLWDIWDMNSME